MTDYEYLNEFDKDEYEDDKDEYEDEYLSDIKAEDVGTIIDHSIELDVKGEKTHKAIPSEYSVYNGEGFTHIYSLIGDGFETDKEGYSADNGLNCELVYSIIKGEPRTKKTIKTNIIKIVQDTPAYKKYKVNWNCPKCDECKHTPTALKCAPQDKFIDLSILVVSDNFEKLRKKKSKRAEDKEFLMYLVGERSPITKKITARFSTTIEPKSKDIILIADEVRPIKEELENFKLTEEDKKNFLEHFKGKKVWKQAIPEMVGKDIAKKSRSLVLHSPIEIPDINGKTISGILNEILIGDTKTNKSESFKDTTTGAYSFGRLLQAENSGRTGLSYAIDVDNKMIRWGALPNNDRGYIACDSLNAFPQEDIIALREVLENKEVSVDRVIKGKALARTRISASANPEKQIKDYMFRAQALKHCKALPYEPDITRWAIPLIFSEGDVENSRINEHKPAPKPIPEDIYHKHILWVGAIIPEQIEYTPEAKKLIKKHTTDIQDIYLTPALPVVHKGTLKTVQRIAVAKACEQHSTDETQERIIITPEIVEMAVKFYREVLDDLELKEFKEESEGGDVLDLEEYYILQDKFSEPRLNDTLRFLKVGGKTAEEIGKELGVSEDTVKRTIYPELKEAGLITTKSKTGARLTARGINFVKYEGKTGAVLNPQVLSAEVIGRDTESKTLVLLKKHTGKNGEVNLPVFVENFPEHSESIDKLLEKGELYKTSPEVLRIK